MYRWWIAAMMLLVACSGSGREGLGPAGKGVADGRVGEEDSHSAMSDSTLEDAGPQSDIGPPPCIDCDVTLLDAPDVPLPPTDIIAPDVPEAPPGCCYTTDDCPPNTAGAIVFCVGQQTSPNGMGMCMGPPVDEGWCYADEHCPMGQECHGAAVCGCNIDCDPPYLGPGICVPEAPGCVAIEEDWVDEICNAASVVIWDGQQCKATCPGCCGCEPFCNFTFQSLEECQTACGAPLECPTFIGAKAEAPFVYQQAPGDCVTQEPMAGPCKNDADCPGGYPDGTDAGGFCVLGNCAFCWNDAQCSNGQKCRNGRCVEPMVGCAPVECGVEGCQVITPSELPCPVCICDSVYGIACSADQQCQILSSHPYAACVNGRCADCRNDGQCPSMWGPGGASCVAPGICYDMTPPAFAIYGLWMIGWPGGLNHFSYFRFEPDGTLRRGAYDPPVAWADDMPPINCYVPGQPSPLLGTWEPEVTQSGFLVVKIRLNAGCDGSDGYNGRWLFSMDDTWQSASVQDIDSDWQWDAQKMPMFACMDDMSWCQNPEDFMPW